MSTTRQGASGSGQGVSSMNYQDSSARTAWSGWVIFAATMMVLVGVFTFIDGLVSLFNAGYYGSATHLLLGNFQSWGWWNLAVGVILVAAGFSLFTGAPWARIVGILLAAVNALSQLVFLAVFPFWALIVIGLNIVVIYALTVNQEVA
jgi:hypothetical protein